MEKLLEQPMTDTCLSEENQENREGSMLGKFKDATSLLEAYQNLESEFTRKCQKLSELQKENEKLSSGAEAETYLSVDDFVSRNADMDKYKKDIEEICKFDEVKDLPNKYQVAYLIARQSQEKSAKLLNDPEFLDEQIKNNDSVKDKIICNYLSEINSPQSLSNLSGSSSGIYLTPKAAAPKTIREAGEIFSKMLN